MPKTNATDENLLIFAAVMHDGEVRRCCRFNITDWHEANLVVWYDPNGHAFIVGKNRYGQHDYAMSELDEVEYLIQDTLEQMPPRPQVMNVERFRRDRAPTGGWTTEEAMQAAYDRYLNDECGTGRLPPYNVLTSRGPAYDPNPAKESECGKCEHCGTLLNGSAHHGIPDKYGPGMTGWCPNDPNRPGSKRRRDK